MNENQKQAVEQPELPVKVVAESIMTSLRETNIEETSTEALVVLHVFTDEDGDASADVFTHGNGDMAIMAMEHHSHRLKMEQLMQKLALLHQLGEDIQAN